MAEGGALRELLVSFGVEVDSKELEKFDEGLTGVIEHIKHATVAFGAFLALGEVKEFFGHTIEQAAALEDLSHKLDIGTDALQKFQFAASLHGVENGGQLLGRLSRQIGNASEGSKDGAKEFARFGIHLKNADGSARETMDVVDDMADAFQKMKDGPTRAAAATKFFGREGMAILPLLKDGSKGLHEVYDEFESLGGMMSEDFIHSAHDADDEVKKMNVAFTGLRVRAVNAFLPSIIKMIKGIKDSVIWFQKLTDGTHALQHAFDFLKILAIAAGVWKVVSAVRALSEAEAVADLFNPFTMALVAIGLLYVAYDDLKTALEGGKSLFGDVFGPGGVDALRKAIDYLTVGINYLYSALVRARDVAQGLFRLTQALALAENHDFKGAMNRVRSAAKDFDDATSPGEVPNIIGAGPARNPIGPPTPSDAAQSLDRAWQLTMHNNLKVEVKHTGNEDPKELAGVIGAGTQKALQKEMLNSLNSVKTQ